MTRSSGDKERTARAALALRLAGASYSEIAETLVLHSTAEARTIVCEQLASIGSDAVDRDALRAEEAARIERLMRSVWGKATDARDPEHLPAVKVALGLVDRHIRLLGLDMPTEMVVYTPTTTEIDQWVAGMLELGGAGSHGVEEADILAIEA